ncbi:MAG TPA: hypothetical protein VHR15_16255 [Ktedonobacterales bacterium]|jgi:hypothetical protein|nr:hypothetical protein [Ktedonobacterales bacterium]
MAKFLLVYMGGVRETQPTPEESAAIIKDWMDWFDSLGENLVDAGNPTTPLAKSIASDGAVSDGALGDSRVFDAGEDGQIEDAVRSRILAREGYVI